MVIIKYFHIVERTYVPWPEQSHLMEENKISGLNKNCLPYFLLFTSQWHRSHSPESLPIRIAAIIKINIIYYIMKITKRSTKHCNVSPNCLCICHKLSQQLTSDDQFQLIVIHFPFLITCRFLDITTYTQFQVNNAALYSTFESASYYIWQLPILRSLCISSVPKKSILTVDYL